MRPRETPNLEKWREASKVCVRASLESADLFTEYLALGGPDAIKALNQTIRKLQLQLEDVKADGRLERYRKLQKDLEECDKVRDGLRAALLSAQWTDDQVDEFLQRRLFRANTLYGSSRELLLKENRLLRAQLEEHLVSTRTSRGHGPPPPSRAAVPESKIKQARMMQGAHMENMRRLVEAAEDLDRAERGYKLPSVSHAEVQADDGSRKYIQTMEKQLATLAGQKLQLMQQLAAMTEQKRVLDMKLEGAMDQVAELRRQKTEMLAHQENLSKELRDHLVAEAKRADTAEISLGEMKLVATAAREAEAAAKEQMERAMAEAQAMQAALQEKAEQVDTLRGLYLELRETLEKLAGDVTTGQQETARRLLDATKEEFEDHKAILGDVKAAVVDTYHATQHNTDTVVGLTMTQRELVQQVARTGETAAVTLAAYERQLMLTQQLLQNSEADRAQLVRQAIAASALARIDERRHESAVKKLLDEVPRAVTQQLGPKLEALEEGTLMLAEEVAKTKDTLADAGVLPGHLAAMLHPPMVPDEVDDATTRLIGDSKALRAQLIGLSAGQPPHMRDEPGPAGFAGPGPLRLALEPPPGPYGPPWGAAVARGPVGPGFVPVGGVELEPIWPHPVAPAFVESQGSLVPPPPGYIVAPAGEGEPMGRLRRMDLMLQLPPRPPPQPAGPPQPRGAWDMPGADVQPVGPGFVPVGGVELGPIGLHPVAPAGEGEPMGHLRRMDLVLQLPPRPPPQPAGPPQPRGAWDVPGADVRPQVPPLSTPVRPPPPQQQLVPPQPQLQLQPTQPQPQLPQPQSQPQLPPAQQQSSEPHPALQHPDAPGSSADVAAGGGAGGSRPPDPQAGGQEGQDNTDAQAAPSATTPAGVAPAPGAPVQPLEPQRVDGTDVGGEQVNLPPGVAMTQWRPSSALLEAGGPMTQGAPAGSSTVGASTGGAGGQGAAIGGAGASLAVQRNVTVVGDEQVNLPPGVAVTRWRPSSALLEAFKGKNLEEMALVQRADA